MLHTLTENARQGLRSHVNEAIHWLYCVSSSRLPPSLPTLRFYQPNAMNSDSSKVLCKCVRRCGGPEGAGKLWASATVYKHKKADRDAIEHARHAQVVAARETSRTAPGGSNPTDSASTGATSVLQDDGNASIRMDSLDGDRGEEQNPGDLHSVGDQSVRQSFTNPYL